jgi:hypothetical protein
MKTTKKINRESALYAKAMKEYAVQETIGGWRQSPILIGTLQECQEFCEGNPSRFARSIVLLSKCEVDYL